jgi:hypothetical protein
MIFFNDNFVIQIEECTMSILPTNWVEVEGIFTREEQQKHGRLVTGGKHHLKIQYKEFITHS